MIEKYDFSLTSDEQNQLDAALQTAQDILVPKLIDLTGDEIRELPKMGEKTLGFVQTTSLHMEQNPTLVPTFLSAEATKRELEGVHLLKTYYNLLEQMCQMVSDSSILLGSEAYKSSLSFYNTIKGAAKADVPGAKMICDDMKKCFPGR